jgi:hypothetical protein
MSQKEVCLVTRNEERYDDMAYLKNRLPDTDILQEYFIPYDRMPEFVDGLRGVVIRDQANLLNVTIRTVHKDEITALPYAKENMFGFVLYFNVKFNDRDNEILEKTTSDLIDVAQRAGAPTIFPTNTSAIRRSTTSSRQRTNTSPIAFSGCFRIEQKRMKSCSRLSLIVSCARPRFFAMPRIH